MTSKLHAEREGARITHDDASAPHPANDAWHDSPRMTAQRVQIETMFGPAAQRQAIDEEEPVQARADEGRGGLPGGLRTGMEALSGVDLSDVQVHRNSDRPAQLNALAYAQGSDIHLAPGQEQHLPHEAWHVVQQKQGRVAATAQLAGTNINDDEELEREADAMGEKASSAAPVTQARAMRTAAPGGPGAWTFQLRRAKTGVKSNVAGLIYKNHAKGDPPFKPQHGNFGPVSWFSGTGNPYVGGQARQYDVMIDVDLGGEPNRLHNTWFTNKLTQWDPSKTLRYDKGQHAAFWKYLGSTLDGQGLAEVYIPVGTMNRQGAGTFVTADASARSGVALHDPGKLATDLGIVSTGRIDQAVAAGARGKGSSFDFTTIVFHKGETEVAMSETIEWAQRDIGPLIPGSSNVEFEFSATDASHLFASEDMDGFKAYKIAITVTYPDYLSARRDAKSLADAMRNLKGYYDCQIIKGTNWKDTAIRGYNESY